MAHLLATGNRPTFHLDDQTN